MLPDVMLGLFDYREGFNLSLRVNFVDGGEESEGLIFTGSEGTMEIGWQRGDGEPRAARDGAGLYDRYLSRGDAETDRGKAYEKKYPPHFRARRRVGSEKYEAPQGLQRQLRPLQEFLCVGAVAPAGRGGCGIRLSRGGRRAVEQSEHREAEKSIKWDPDAMKAVL